TLRLTVPAELVNRSYPLLLTSRWGDSADTPATVRVFGPEAPYGPEQPTAVAGPHSATVTWPLPGEDSWPATSYEVTAWVDGEVVATRSVTDPTATFTGLSAELSHTFTAVAVNEVGRSEASFASPAIVPAGPDISPFTSITKFVQRQERDLLDDLPGHPTDQWIARLRAGTHLPADLVVDLRATRHHVTHVDPVARLYLAYFRRPPEPAGLRYWSRQMFTGFSIDHVSQAFAASAEFRALYGPLSNRAFVERIYLNGLGRPGEPAGVAYWTAELDSGRRNRGTVMRGFSESTENRGLKASKVTVAVLWAQMLERVPTATELATTAARLDDGTTVAAIAGEILSSDEYATRISG
ncbi:MAG TPA: DUF4214 domain-containing protein, partial [Iamia sp.]|nr:DUF4214 domain-containing protein [Iamia sp.]